MPLNQIAPDPEFPNLRLPATEEELIELRESMRREGLKVPIVVVSRPPDSYLLRAGFRRTDAARQLGWRSIPAIIRPPDTPQVEEYWINILENTRSRLTTYEIALAAQTMRDKFGIRPSDFATRAGYAETYVVNLVRALDRLPDEIVEVWMNKAPIPAGYYVKWSSLNPEEAIKMMLSYCGKNKKLTGGWAPPQATREKVHPVKMATSRGLARMQRLRFAVEVARDLDPEAVQLCLAVIDYCAGAREDVPRIFDPRRKLRPYKSRRRDDLDDSELPDTCTEDNHE